MIVSKGRWISGDCDTSDAVLVIDIDDSVDATLRLGNLDIGQDFSLSIEGRIDPMGSGVALGTFAGPSNADIIMDFAANFKFVWLSVHRTATPPGSSGVGFDFAVIRS